MALPNTKTPGPSVPAKRWTTAVAATRSRATNLRRKAATVVAGAIAIFMSYHVVFGHNGLTAYEHKRQDAALLHQQAKDLERENNRLRDHVERLQTDPGAIEVQARQELHYTRAGEVIYTLPPDPVPARTPSAAPAPTTR